MKSVKNGQWVVVLGAEKEGAARISHPIVDPPGGVVLDRHIDGFRCWNVEHLRPATKEEAGAAAAAEVVSER